MKYFERRVPQRPSYSGIGRKRTHRKSRLTKIGGEVKQRIGYKGGLSLDTQQRRVGHTRARMEALEIV